MNFPVMYKKSKKAVLQQWQIFIEGNTYFTEAGQVGGAITQSLPTEVLGKNAGKANETSDTEQTLKEVLAIITKQKEKGYNEDVKDAGKVDYFKPMLAKNFNDYKDRISYPVISQIKIDGIRSILTSKGMFTRTGKPILACPHIFELLKKHFIADPSLILDGELYSHGLNRDFDTLVSLIKKSKPTQEDLEESKKYIQYWIFDIPSNKTFSERFKFVDKLVDNKYIIKVESTYCNNQKDLDRSYEKYLEDGFEGQMIRTNSKYENCRTQALLKRKEHQDEEFKIVDVVEGVGNWVGAAGAVVLTNKNGVEFKATPKMTYELKKELLRNKHEIIGQMGTVRFQNYTPDSLVPRFPRFLTVRDYE